MSERPLSKTAYVILGMLRLDRRTGYEIKSLVDVSTRFFWAASYGQIYPELARLEDGGLPPRFFRAAQLGQISPGAAPPRRRGPDPGPGRHLQRARAQGLRADRGGRGGPPRLAGLP